MEKGKTLLNSARPLIELALKEDIGDGDITTDAIVPENTEAAALFTAKAGGVLCGLGIAKGVFDSIQKKSVTWIIHKREGDILNSGDLIAEVRGNYRVLLTGERTALNFMQRMSGVASSARRFAEKLEGTKAKLLDTRKTLPGFRALDKYAVKTGGGENHRAGLFDMVMIKDNHIKAAGSIKIAVDNVRKKYADKFKVEVETANLIEVEEALRAGADIIMLDNMNIELMTEAVSLIGGDAVTEASGNVELENIREVAETGVDYISVGALTHSAKALDISMKFS